MGGSDDRPARALCFANPNARAVQNMAGRFVSALEERGVAVEMQNTSSQEDALQRIRDAGTADAILVAGGDGTISGLLPALLEREEPVGILPLGTANDFARGLGLAQDPAAAADAIAGGYCRQVDVGRINDRPFLNVASLGISVEIADLHEDGIKKTLGRFAYPMRWAEAWRRHRPPTVSVTVDGTERRARVSLLAVGCGRYYGGGMVVEETARPDDGSLRLYYIEPRPLSDWFYLVPNLLRGRQRQHAGVFSASAREIEIRAGRKKGLGINVDGEVCERTPARINIEPGRLRVLAPAPDSEPKKTIL